MPFSIFGKKKQTKPPADKEGILFIEKSNGKFSSKKWFELRNTILSMHKSKEKNNKTIKQIELVQYETRIIDIENYKNNSHTFGVKPAGEDTVWLAAPDEEERSQWIQYLKDIVQPDAKYNIPDEILKHLKNEKGHHEIIQQIKDDKFDMNKRHRARHNNSLLMLAVESNHFPLVRELVDINADIDMKNDHGNTALLLACSLGYHKIVSKLLSRADKTVTDPRGRNGLFLAVEFERWDVALSLVDDPDIDANAKDIQTGRTVLHHAVAKNNMECIFKLVNERHVKVDIVDYKGYTPADYAAMQDLTPIVTLLLENGSRLPIDEDRDAQDEVEGEVEDEEKSNNNQNNKNTDDSKDGEIESENQDKNQDENNEEKEKEQTENRGEEKTENKDSEDKNDDQSETKNKEDQGEDKSENHHEIQEQEKEEDEKLSIAERTEKQYHLHLISQSGYFLNLKDQQYEGGDHHDTGFVDLDLKSNFVFFHPTRGTILWFNTEWECENHIFSWNGEFPELLEDCSIHCLEIPLQPLGDRKQQEQIIEKHSEDWKVLDADHKSVVKHISELIPKPATKFLELATRIYEPKKLRIESIV
eukprot:gb/GECH01008806.1/.p1 GENE.gb/GECH01008806.1/~~gb/GECH01008806.1/.p1  ORF type:complete len:588 (+),score=197.12 gb/GECH01008806.1/:1-1764(+)